MILVKEIRLFEQGKFSRANYHIETGTNLVKKLEFPHFHRVELKVFEKGNETNGAASRLLWR